MPSALTYPVVYVEEFRAARTTQGRNLCAALSARETWPSRRCQQITAW